MKNVGFKIYLLVVLTIGLGLYLVSGINSVLLFLLFSSTPVLFLRLWVKFESLPHRIFILFALIILSILNGIMTYWGDPNASSIFLIAFNLIVLSFCLTALLGDTLFRPVKHLPHGNKLIKASKYISLIIATTVGLAISSMVYYTVFGPMMPSSDITCPEYKLLISIDEEGKIAARHKLMLSLKWKDEGDIEKNSKGEIKPFKEQRHIAEYLKSDK
jgi:hypothetical protein